MVKQIFSAYHGQADDDLPELLSVKQILFMFLIINVRIGARSNVRIMREMALECTALSNRRSNSSVRSRIVEPSGGRSRKTSAVGPLLVKQFPTLAYLPSKGKAAKKKPSITTEATF